MEGANVRPVAGYFGGKRNLSKRLIERIRAVPHELYGEAFVGMGGVFLRRPERAKIEVINDRSKDVATLFRILQRHYQAFLDQLKWQLTSRAEFERLVAVDPDTLTDLERAARFLYLQRTAFGGKLVGRNFGTSRTGPARFDLTKLVPLLEDVHERLASVVIECLGFDEFLARYDRPGALFYLDPPYWGCERDYGPGFERADFARLAAQLATLKGRFLLSLNDQPEIRETFRAFQIDAVETTYTVAAGDNMRRARELIISN
jgi:DNA adenine methylase